MAATLSSATSLDELTGPQKAAILCMALGTESAAMLTRGLTAEEVELISLEIARTPHVPRELSEAVLAEWVEMMLGAGSMAEGGMDYARQVLEKAFGAQRAQLVLKRIQAELTDAAGLHRLRNADPLQLGAMLRAEHPQTAALILAHLEPAHTAAVLKALEPAAAADVMFRIARMESVAPEMLRLIERTLAADTDLAVSRGQPAGGAAAAAAVLNLVTGPLEHEIMRGVAGRDPKLGDEIKRLMFVFEDLMLLDDRATQRLLREVETKELALALKVASDALTQKFVGALTQRAAAALREEMELLGPVRMREVEGAQSRIIAEVRALEAMGEISLGRWEQDALVP